VKNRHRKENDENSRDLSHTGNGHNNFLFNTIHEYGVKADSKRRVE